MISDSDIASRLVVAALLGSVIGLERERRMWSAGIRTHMLVSVGACLFMIVSAYGFQESTQMPHVVLDPSRIAAQVVSGIGFLGAGSILMRGNSVRGLTTAASIWSVAALGLASGGGMFFAAGISTMIILLILAGMKPLEEAYRARVQSCVVHMRAERGALTGEQLRKALNVRGGQIRRLEVTPAENGLEDTTIHLVRVSEADIRTGAKQLRDQPSVIDVRVTGKHRERAIKISDAEP